MTEYRVRSKVWLEFNDQPFFGEGRYRLLTAVERTGSINAAAKDLGISYRKAWSQLDAMDKNAPFALIEKQSGGKGGGETRLTADARKLLLDYRRLSQQVHRQTDQAFSEIFPCEA